MVANSLGCSSQDSAKVDAIIPDLVNIIVNKKYHPSEQIIFITTYPLNSYLWFNGVTTPNDTVMAYQFGPPGVYSVWCQTVDRFGCKGSDTVSFRTDYNLSMQPNNKTEWSIYPNPFTDAVQITSAKNDHLAIFSADGKWICDIDLKNGQQTLVLNHLQSGVYFVRSESGQVVKLIKQ